MQSKKIKFGDPEAAYSQDPGVSVSRVPRIASKAEKAVSFIIDPEKTPPNKPLAEPEPYQKTKSDYTHKTWVNFASPEELENFGASHDAKELAWENYNNAQATAHSHQQLYNYFDFKNDPDRALRHAEQASELSDKKNQAGVEYDRAITKHQNLESMLKAKYYKDVLNATTGKTMSKHFEFENRTKGKDIPVTAIKGIAIDESALDNGWDNSIYTKVQKERMKKLREQAEALGIPVHSFEDGKKFNRYRANFLRTGPISKNLRPTSEVAS